MPNLVDLSTTLTDNGTDHIVRNVDLLGHWLSRDYTSNRGSSGRGVGLNRCRCAIRSGLMGTSAGIRSARRSAVVKRRLSNRGRNRLSLKVGDTIRASCSPVRLSVSLEGVRMAILTTCWLRNVGYDLHATRNNTSRATTPGSIRRRSWASKSLSELLNEGNGNIVGCNVNSISNTEDNEGTFGRQRKASIRGIQACTRGFLDLANADTTLADNGTD